MWEDSGVTMSAQEAFALARRNDIGEDFGQREQEVIELLRAEGKLKPEDIAAKLGWKPNNT